MIKKFVNWLDKNTTQIRKESKNNQSGLAHLLELLEAKESSLVQQLDEEHDPKRRKRLYTELQVTRSQLEKGLRLLNKQP